MATTIRLSPYIMLIQVVNVLIPSNTILFLHCGPNSLIYLPPELYDFWIGLSPGINDRFELVFRKALLKGTHSNHRTDTAAVTKGQFRNLTFLSKLTIYPVFHNRYAKHLRCGPSAAYGLMCAASRTGSVFSPVIAQRLWYASVTTTRKAPCPDLNQCAKVELYLTCICTDKPCQGVVFLC